MSDTAKKVTKKDLYNVLIDVITCAEDEAFSLPEDVTYDSLREFVNHEIELLDKKTAAAQNRAAQKKAEGDELREKIFSMLSTTEFKTISDLHKAIDDPDVSPQKITSRLTQLVRLERVEKDMVSIETEGGKTKKASAYRVKEV